MKMLSRPATLFSCIATLLLASLVFVYVMGQLVIRANRQLLSDENMLESLHQTLSMVKDAETGQRGYLLTGEDSYLAPYEDAQRHIADQLNSLNRRGADEVLDAARIDQLRQLIGKKMAELDQTIGIGRSKGFDAARAEIRKNVGKMYMDEIRQVVGVMTDQEHQAVNAQATRASEWEIARTGSFTLVTLFDLAFLLWAYDAIRKERAAKASAAAEVLRQKNILGVTLSSIGDAVIVTDVNRKIVFLNDVAQQLTGWSDQSALGEPCDQVFKIINEKTRQTVESPVDKVLRTGKIVGLANHTLLIQKDGSELPIDDSGSPVRDASGQIHGAVLIFRDFSLQREAANKLNQAMRDLETANASKDRFVAMISHELRTPLTPVLGTLTSWAMADAPPETWRADVRMLQWNIQLEARLIDDLLDLTRINSGKLSLRLATADIHPYVRAVLSMFQREIDEKNLQISVKLNATRSFVQCDTARLQQVFWNVLKNSAKFTAKGGSIAISTENQGDRVIVKFTDSGIGMSPETLSRIFNPFEQADAGITKHFGGLGLGLTISKELTEGHQGTLEAKSAGVGHGSTFIVTLPTVDTPIETPAAAAPVAPDKTPRKLRILLVEDHADTAMVISLLLKKFGHSVDSAGSVAAGIERFGAEQYDLLLSDLGLPDGTGLDFIRKIRETSQVPAIALTGYGMEEDIARCTEAGFNAHLTKPINFQELDALIRKLS